MSTFPVFDLSQFTNAPPTEKKSLGHQVDEICRQTGFLAITGHGIPDETITRAWNSARAFFDLPIEKKLAVKMRYEGYPYGYSPLQSEALAKSKGEDTPPDIKETFNIGPLTLPPHTGNEPFEVAFLFGVEVAGLLRGRLFEVGFAHSAGTRVGAASGTGAAVRGLWVT